MSRALTRWQRPVSTASVHPAAGASAGVCMQSSTCLTSSKGMLSGSNRATSRLSAPAENVYGAASSALNRMYACNSRRTAVHIRLAASEHLELADNTQADLDSMCWGLKHSMYSCHRLAVKDPARLSGCCCSSTWPQTTSGPQTTPASCQHTTCTLLLRTWPITCPVCVGSKCVHGMQDGGSSSSSLSKL